MKLLAWTIGLFAATSLFAQSPNLQQSVIKLNASDFQTRSERNLPNGYPSLDGSGLVLPETIMPGFAGAPVGSVWVKNLAGTALVPQPGVTISSDSFTVGNITIGQYSPTLFGIKAGGAFPLILAGGSTNLVYVEYGQSIGGSNSSHSAYRWSVGPDGTFALAGGGFSADVDLNSNSLTEVATITGSGMEFDMTTSTVTLGSGNLTITIAGGGGVIVPSTGSLINPTRALNTTAANLIYGQLGANNTFAGINTFSQAPLVPINSFTEDRITGLVSDLAALLKRDGTAPMTGSLNLNSNKIINLANPTVAQDAVTLNYLTSYVTANTVNSLTATAPLVVAPPSPAQGNITISIPLATSAQSGYLSATDRQLFAGKENVITFTSPLARGGNIVTLPAATSLANGYLTALDWVRFNSVSSGYTNGKIPIGSNSGTAVPANITAGTNVSIVNGVNSITISATSPTTGTKGAIFANVNTSGTITPTQVFSYSLLANQLNLQDVIRVHLDGRFGFMVANTTQQFTVTMKLNGAVICAVDSPFSTGIESDHTWEANINLTLRAIGSGSAWRSFSKIDLMGSAAGPYETRSTGITAAPGNLIDTTIAQNLTIEITQNTAGSNFVNVEQAYVSIN